MRHFGLAGLPLLLLACQSGAAIGTGCTRPSECASPLVCRLERCRTECVAARDCPAGQACLINEDGLGACELPALDVCSLSCDPPLICASGHCRVECTIDTDCPGGHVCRSGACQRTDGTVDGGGGTDDASTNDAGTDAAQAGHDAASDAGLVCDPVNQQGCTAPQRCGLVSGVPACVDVSGTLDVGASCSDETVCRAGLSCQGGRCVRICPFPNDGFCGVDSVCSLDSVHGQDFLPSENGIGLCSEACDPFDDTGCPRPDASCAFGVGSTSDYTWCRDVGVIAENFACMHPYDCVAGLDCYMGFCRAFCLAAGGTGCLAGRHCAGSTNFTSRRDVGACVP